MRQAKLFPGDLVEVKPFNEIVKTLDANGTLDSLPFMPEMVEFCGRRYRVSKRVIKTCFSGSMSTMRKFRNGDVVLLESLRCSGSAHDGCQKACMIFWREAWLRKVEHEVEETGIPRGESLYQLADLKTKRDSTTYLCQASELLQSTDPLSRAERLALCVEDVRAGNTSIVAMALNIGTWLFWRARRAILGEFARGKNKATPAQSLNLSPGEWVEVKSIGSIRETLNEKARNRGLYFSPDMRRMCGRRERVARRIDKIIVDGTGEMRQLRNTIYLEGSLCGCAHVAFGGCSRCEFTYWREIWLTRVGSQAIAK